MIQKIKRWITQHYILTLLTFFFVVTISIIGAEIVLEHYFPSINVDKLNTSIQFLTALLGGLCSSIVVIYASNLQNKSQLSFLHQQELHERERLLLTFYIDKIKEFEHKHKTFIKFSNDFILNEPTMSEQEIKTYFNRIRDTLWLLYRFEFVFKHIELTEEWQQLHIYFTNVHDFFVTETNNMNQQQRNPQLNVEFKDQHYFPIIILLSNISDKLLHYQAEQIMNLVP